MKKFLTDKCFQLTFKSLDEAIEYAIKTPSLLDEEERSGKQEQGREWAGAATWKEGLKIMREGLPLIGKQIRQESSNAGSILFGSIPKPGVGFNVWGQVIDMGRFLRGEPECCLQMEQPDEDRLKTLEIVVNSSVRASQDSKKVQTRGIAIAALIKVLESVGVSVRVWGACVYYRSSREVQFWIKFKEYGEPLNLSQLALQICSPLIHRKLGFVIAETAPMQFLKSIGINKDGGYGQPENFECWHEQKNIPVKPGYLYMPILDGQKDFDSLEGAKQWVEARLQEYLPKIKKEA